MPDFVMPPRNTSSPFAAMSGHHVAIRVPDFDKAKAWYTEKLDWRVVHEWPFADERLAREIGQPVGSGEMQRVIARQQAGHLKYSLFVARDLA